MGSMSLALACVMAGSGDLDCLRLFRTLRWKVDVEQTYGSHMVYGMAIGTCYHSYAHLVGLGIDNYYWYL